MNLKERIELVNQNKITSSFNDFEIKEDIEVERIPFTIDMAFQDGFDFF